MSVQTTTQLSQENYTLFLRSVNEKPPFEQLHLYIENLGDLLLKYENWNDSLSEKLLKWGNKTFLEVKDPNFVINEDTKQRALNRINKLTHQILINPLGGSPLRAPVLERTWIWEKSDLEDYAALRSQSPFDEQQLEAARPHDFALDMLKWISGVQKTFNLTTDTLSISQTHGTLVVSSETIPNSFARCITYLSLANNFLTRQQNKNNLQLKEILQNLREQRRTMEEKLEAEVTLTRSAAATLQKNTEESINTIKSNHQDQVQSLRTLISQNSAEIDATRRALEAANQEGLKSKKEIDNLKNCYRSAIQEQERLRKKADKSSCTIS